MANGKFKVTQLEFKVTPTEFVVDCGDTGHVNLCGQNTAKTFGMPLVAGGIEPLKAALKKALTDLEALNL